MRRKEYSGITCDKFGYIFLIDNDYNNMAFQFEFHA